MLGHYLGGTLLRCIHMTYIKTRNLFSFDQCTVLNCRVKEEPASDIQFPSMEDTEENADGDQVMQFQESEFQDLEHTAVKACVMSTLKNCPTIVI